MLAALLVPMTALLATPALGQGGRGGFDGFGAGVSARDIEQFEKILDLTDDQQELVDALFEGYQQETRAKTEEIREAFRQAREQADADGGGWEQMAERMASFRAERDKMDAAFLTDVQSVLTPEQGDLWPKAERAHRRSRHLARGFIRGERVDLINVIDGMELDSDAAAQIQPILDSYEVELDRQLVKRVEIYENGFREMGELRRAGEMDKLQDLMDKGREASLRVSDVNDRFARQIGGALPEGVRVAFTSKVRQTAYPDVFRAGNARNAITAALGFADLTPEQAEQIGTLSVSFDRKVDTVNAKLVDTIQEEEKDATVQGMFQRRGREDGPSEELWREKRTLDRDTVGKLREILTEEQIKRLPEPERERGGRGGGRGGQQRGQIL
jgi:Spy/CpxP family protein refolding chaperone